MWSYLLEFVCFFLFFLTLGYLVPAGQYYLRFYVWKSKWLARPKIQPNRHPDRAQILREVKLSVICIAIFAAMGAGLYELYKAGYTSIYHGFSDYSLIYLPISVFLCLVLHDTYFYWTHRAMHSKLLFKYTHLGHHRSVSPTPWAIYAFQPAEAVIQGIGIMLIVIFLPLHPLALFIYLAIDTEVNTAGHTGYEMIPPFISKQWFYRGLNTVTHHDHHHTHMNKNFGAFFNVWDRLMGTFMDRMPADRAAERTASENHPLVESKTKPVTTAGREPSRPSNLSTEA